MAKTSDKTCDGSDTQALPQLIANCLAEVKSLIEKAAPVSEAYSRITEICLGLPGLKGAAIYLAEERTKDAFELLLRSQSGSGDIPPPETAIEPEDLARHQAPRQTFVYYPIGSTSPVDGVLGVEVLDNLKPEVESCLRDLAFLTGLLCERDRLGQAGTHYEARLKVLTQLQQLMAAGVSLSRIMQVLAREAAFAFDASCALTFLLSDSSEELLIKGSFGFPPKSLPETIPLGDTRLEGALRVGSIMSLMDIRAQRDAALELLQSIGAQCVHCTSIETRGKVLGALLIGYQHSRYLTEYDATILEDFAKGAALAITNARAQEQLTVYTERLEEIIQARTAELAVAMAHAEEASRAKSEFVANMSHELRTPLTAIVGYSSVLVEGLFGPINDQQKQALESIARSSEHLKDLINEVLDISKIEAGKEQVSPAIVELPPLLKQIHQLMVQTAVGKGVELSLPQLIDDSDGSEIVRLWIDPRHIRQILINLLSNAIKYTPTGGSVSLSVEIVADKAKISVHDTGVGISRSQQEKLFERYERFGDSYSREQIGTGLGLSLTKHLVDINGGNISVESEIGSGSTFSIYIPLAAEQTPSESRILDKTPSESELTMCRLDGLNVLIVDDNELTCQVLSSIISSVGGKPFVAHSVQEARETVRGDSLDAALVDLAMPKENGLVLIDFIRKECEPPVADMPLIVVSACVFSNDRQQAFERGASYFIAKPFRPAEVVQTIRQLTTTAVINSSSGRGRFLE